MRCRKVLPTPSPSQQVFPLAPHAAWKRLPTHLSRPPAGLAPQQATAAHSWTKLVVPLCPAHHARHSAARHRAVMASRANKKHHQQRPSLQTLLYRAALSQPRQPPPPRCSRQASQALPGMQGPPSQHMCYSNHSCLRRTCVFDARHGLVGLVLFLLVSTTPHRMSTISMYMPQLLAMPVHVCLTAINWAA